MKTPKELEKIAYEVRRSALEAVQSAKSGHIGGAFSVAEILTVLYFDKMNIDVNRPDWEDRDRFVLSKGHCSAGMYAVLAKRGYFPEKELKTFRRIDSNLSGHVEMKYVQGVDMSAGSLGQGLSAATGMALSAKMFNKSYRTYAVLGDGEIQEGQIWEAAMAAGSAKLDNLTVFVDNNDLQIDGHIGDVMSPYPIEDKFKAFNWNILSIDGHDTKAISDAVDKAVAYKGKPTAIIAKTVKGKGVSIMENLAKWHGSVPTDEEFDRAFAELNARIAELEA